MPSLDTGLKNLIFQLNLHTVSCRVITFLFIKTSRYFIRTKIQMLFVHLLFHPFEHVQYTWKCFLPDYGVDKYDIGTGFGHFGVAVEDVSQLL